MNTFADRLKTLRKDADMTQDALAARLGCTKQAVSHYENGSREPNMETIRAIADIFRVPAGYLHGDDDRQDMQLTKEERDLVYSYRDMDDVARGMVTRLFEYIKGVKKEG